MAQEKKPKQKKRNCKTNIFRYSPLKGMDSDKGHGVDSESLSLEEEHNTRSKKKGKAQVTADPKNRKQTRPAPAMSRGTFNEQKHRKEPSETRKGANTGKSKGYAEVSSFEENSEKGLVENLHNESRRDLGNEGRTVNTEIFPAVGNEKGNENWDKGPCGGDCCSSSLSDFWGH